MKSSPSIRNAAMDFLARREHSAFELEQKLSKRFDDINAIRATITKLQSDGLQSDRRFAEHYIQARVNKGFGQRKIQQELKLRGIVESCISEVFAEKKIDWLILLLQLYERKYGQQAPENLEQKARCQRFLLSRGFSFDQLASLWRELA